MPDPDLTDGQSRVVEAIEAFVAAHGYPPGQRELMDMVGVNLSTLQGYLARLKAAGVVAWEPGQPRTLRVVR